MSRPLIDSRVNNQRPELFLRLENRLGVVLQAADKCHQRLEFFLTQPCPPGGHQRIGDTPGDNLVNGGIRSLG